MGNTNSERAAMGQGEKAQRRDSRGTKEGERPKILMDSPEDADIFHGEDMKPVITSQLGTVNNIIQVKKTDFEVFDALMVDSQKCSDMSDLSSSPPGPYHQDAYVPKQEEKFKSPPILPPHLLQVILNKDTGISCDPALLPEPNHVMLNHLYALSIKDGVMVLSATHRYKKKMNTLQALFLLAVSLTVAQSLDYKALNQFRRMILCLMPDSWPVFDYSDYGCYCGKGGSGTPVDDLDRCCQVHDQCYSDAMQHPECWPIFDNPYTEFYDYSCDEENKKVTCGNNNDECEMFICECDRKAAECFAKSPWNPEHEHLPSDRCQ